MSIKFLYNFKKSLNFFLWAYVKDIVYWTKVQDISNLKQVITDEGMLQQKQEIEHSHDVLHATNGANIQMY